MDAETSPLKHFPIPLLPHTAGIEIRSATMKNSWQKNGEDPYDLINKQITLHRLEQMVLPSFHFFRVLEEQESMEKQEELL